MAELVLDIDVSGNATVKLTYIEKQLKRVGKEGDDLSRSFKTLGKISDIANSFNLVGRMASGVASGFNMLKTGALAVATAFIDVNSRLEQMNIMLETSTGSVEGANQAFQQIFDFADNAPFALKTISDSYVKLQTAGIDPMNGSLQTLMDSVAAFGGASYQLELVTIAIRQMVGKGVISMEELRRQFGEQVPTAMYAMARGLKMSYSEMVSEIEKGNIRAKDGIQAMLSELAKLHGGAAEKRMKSFQGVIVQLQNTWMRFLKEVGDSNDSFKRVSEYIHDFTVSLKELIQSGTGQDSIDTISRSIVTFFDTLTDNKGTMEGFLEMIIDKVTKTIQLMGSFSRVVVGFLEAVQRMVNAYDMAKIVAKSDSINTWDFMKMNAEDVKNKLAMYERGIVQIDDKLLALQAKREKIEFKAEHPGLYTETFITPAERAQMDALDQQIASLEQVRALELELMVIQQKKASRPPKIAEIDTKNWFQPATEYLDDFGESTLESAKDLGLWAKHLEASKSKVVLMTDAAKDLDLYWKKIGESGKLIAEDPFMSNEQASLDSAKLAYEYRREMQEKEAADAKKFADDKMAFEREMLVESKRLTLSDQKFYEWQLDEKFKAAEKFWEGDDALAKQAADVKAKLLEKWIEDNKKGQNIIDQLWRDFGTSLNSNVKGVLSGIFEGEINTINDLFTALWRAIADGFLDLLATFISNSIIDAIFSDTATAGIKKFFSSLVGGFTGSVAAETATSAGASAVTGGATGAAGVGAWESIKNFFTGTTGAEAVAASWTPEVGAAYAEALAQENAAIMASQTGAEAGGAGAAGMSGGAMAGTAFFVAVWAKGLYDALTREKPKLDQVLTENMVTPFKMAAEGVGQEFGPLYGSLGQAMESFHALDQASLDLASGTLVVGESFNFARRNGEDFNGVMARGVLHFNEATGAWERVGFSVTEAMRRMEELRATTNMSTEAIARMIATEAGIPSISNELVNSYKTQQAAMKELYSTSFAAGEAFRSAAGNVQAAISRLRESTGSDNWSYVEEQAVQKMRSMALGGVTGPTGFKNRIVDRPTIVPMAAGGVLFGEAGSEAVMPLTRVNGKLGVSTDGMASTRDILIALLKQSKKTADVLKRVEKTGLPTTERVGVMG